MRLTNLLSEIGIDTISFLNVGDNREYCQEQLIGFQPLCSYKTPTKPGSISQFFSDPEISKATFWTFLKWRGIVAE